jgi:purine-binding chemotaxis protein CheW
MPIQVQSSLNGTPLHSGLVVRVGAHTCLLNLSDVAEIMRPQPVEPLAGAPEGVRGVSLIRGLPTPVVDLAILLTNDRDSLSTRFVTIRAGERMVALSVDAVLGVREFGSASLSECPPLLQGARPDIVNAIRSLDAELFLVLNVGKVVPDSLWTSLARGDA